MLARGPLPGALQFSPAPPRGLGLHRSSWRHRLSSQSRSPNLSKWFSLRVRLEETGEIYRLSGCHGNTTVRELKEELDLMAGIPFHFQRILYLDQGILMDDSTLGFHDVVPGGILSMCIWHQDGWQELVLAAMEGDASKLSCLGVTEDSLYRTPHSTLLRAEKYKEWIADRAFIALYVAAHKGHTEAVRFLLENGASCLAKTPVGRTALHVAAAMGHVSCINLLLDYGAALNVKDLKGETPIEIARRLKHLEIFLTEEENSINLLESGQHYNALWNLQSVMKLPPEGTVGSVNIQINYGFYKRILKCSKYCSLCNILNFRRSS